MQHSVWATVATRRFAITGLSVLALSLTGCDGASQDEAEDPVPHTSFVSRPDLKPVEFRLEQGAAWDERTEGEYIFITPNFDTATPDSAAMILDSDGQVVWMDPSGQHPDDHGHFDLRVQEYQGEPVLTYFKGPGARGWGYGDFYLLDTNYRVITSVTTGSRLGAHHTDFHDSTITDDDTMLLMAYVDTQTDMTAIGGPAEGWVHDAVIQEVDIATGEVLFEWSALDHVPLTDTMLDFDEEYDAQQDRADDDPDEAELASADKPLDYFHINSVTVDDDHNLLVSARHTHAVYKLDRGTGDILWTLGGSASDYALADEAVFSWQHAAERDVHGNLLLLDNHARNVGDPGTSRALSFDLDETALTAAVAAEYLPPADRPAAHMANAQPLDDGKVIVGWGQQAYFSEYTADGELIYDVCHGDSCQKGRGGGGGSYRAYRAQWQAQPDTIPDAVVQDDVVYVSWNGATQVVSWRVLTGATQADATQTATVAKDGFETAIELDAAADHITLEALDDNGTVLATTVVPQ